MKKLYKLAFNGFTLPVKLGTKLTDTKTSLTRGVKRDGQIKQTKQINVIIKSDVSVISTPEDISEIIPYSSAQTFYVHKEPTTGDKKLVEIDKSYLDGLYANVDDMDVLYKINKENAPWYVLDGGHYPICLNDKLKTREHDVIYQSLVYGMTIQGIYLIVRFISYKRPRYGIIHPYGNGLCVSFVHGSNMLRPYKPVFEQFTYSEDELKTYSNALFDIVPQTSTKQYPYQETMDTYEVELIQYINDVVGGKVRIGETTKPRAPKAHESSLLGKLLSLAESKSHSSTSTTESKQECVSPPQSPQLPPLQSMIDTTEKVEKYLEQSAHTEMDIPDTPNTFHSTIDKIEIDSINPYTQSIKVKSDKKELKIDSESIDETQVRPNDDTYLKLPTFQIDFSKIGETL